MRLLGPRRERQQLLAEEPFRGILRQLGPPRQLQAREGAHAAAADAAAGHAAARTTRSGRAVRHLRRRRRAVRGRAQPDAGTLLLLFRAALQVKRKSDGATKDVGLLSKGGVANSATQDTFCRGTSCTVQRIYDQSPQGNHLDLAPGGSACGGPDNPVNASRERLTVGGHPVYSAYFENHNGYRNIKTKGVATGDAQETMYMVTSGTHYNGGCCFDYGNAEVDSHDDGRSTMEAVYFGSAKGGLNHGGAGPGPWVMVDIENGLFGMNVTNSNEPSMRKADGSQYDYVTAMAKGDSGNHFALKGGDAAAGKLATLWDGNRPPGYSPMHKQGSIILGIGGDNSCSSNGAFYEGVMTIGYSSDAADDKVQANIVAAGYRK